MRPTTALALFLFLPAVSSADEIVDPFLWLEQVDDDKALAWAKEHNAITQRDLEAVPEFAAIQARNLEIYNSNERIPSVAIRGPFLYNFWQDAENERGVWRRTTAEEYRLDNPAWETVLDLDALAEEESENWVWKGTSWLPPSYQRCILSLSRGGGDATVKREFDTTTKKFVDGGFHVAEAKSRVSWKDEDTLWVGSDFGEGSLTDSGYPRTVREWKRGTPLAEAPQVFEGTASEVSAGAYSQHRPEARIDFVYRIPAFFKSMEYVLLGGRQVRLDLPVDSTMKGLFQDQMLVTLRSDWSVGDTTFLQGALLAIDFDDFLAGERSFDVLFAPSDRVSLDQIETTQDQVLLTTLDNVRSRMYRLTYDGSAWKRAEVTLPGLGKADLGPTNDYSTTWYFTYNDFLEPSSLYVVEDGKEPVRVKSMPAFFDATGMTVAQNEATSKDGTKIPYFIVKPKGFAANGKNPTLLYGYGGFEVSMTPGYSATRGTAWLERGGVFVLANIRGGGEFGPKWHQAALKSNRHKAFEDFIAVAEDLVAHKVTSPAHLGIMGGSNGGLLVGAAMTMRPDLFGAVVCQVPLLDMRRYHELLAGASWMAEYGDPDVPEEWSWIKTWSPYHNLDPKLDYPRALFYTSTRDDRVHPGHARKMVARLAEMKKPVYYYENTEGGHSAAANNKQRAHMWALSYAYLWKLVR